ncbi:hypothetical protein HOC37_00580 [bacterium]|jgi:hypothetical protein|nr:hypothetical protein [bacterium]MBT3580900.1 hypothetical protein [bacterium]MBT4551460.1 hypothetical protein [bacterium]
MKKRKGMLLKAIGGFYFLDFKTIKLEKVGAWRDCFFDEGNGYKDLELVWNGLGITKEKKK